MPRANLRSEPGPGRDNFLLNRRLLRLSSRVALVKPAVALPTDDTASLGWRLARFIPIVGILYAGYQILNRWHLRPPQWLPLSAVDRAIPVLPWTVWPYLFLAGCIGLILAAWRRSTFWRAMQALMIGYPIDLLIFAVFPTTYPRVETVPGDGWTQMAFNFLFAVDTPANCFPSGHITAPLIACWALATDFPRARIPLWIAFAGLSVTILTTKQHYVVDLFGGLATGLFGLWISGRLARRSAALNASLVPTPWFNFGAVNVVQFQRDPLGFLARLMRECGPVASCRIAWHPRVVVNDAHLARTILNLPHTASNKRTRSVAAIRRICGESVLTADRDSWFRHRRLVQPAFHRQQVARHVDTMAGLSRAMIEEWTAAAQAGQPVEVTIAMRRLTFRFVCKALFNADPSAEIAQLEACIVHVLEETWRSIRSPLDLAMRSPTRRRRRFQEALAGIDAFVTRMISARRRAPGETADLLSLLLAARDEHGGMLSDEEIRNESVTLLIAGYDTTANALAWAVSELAQHPAVAERLSHEAGAVLNGRLPALADLPALPYARAVFLETLRLHPPIWILERNLEAPVISGEWRLPMGTQVLITPYFLHRLPAHWEKAGAFEPARFVGPGDHAEENPAYLPFGTGPRSCIGKQLSLLEGHVFLATLANAGRFRRVAAVPPETDAGISLRPLGELWMHFEPRTSAARSAASATSVVG